MSKTPEPTQPTGATCPVCLGVTSPCWYCHGSGLDDAPAARVERKDVLMDVLASLVAAVSLLKRGGKKAAPSDRMFDQMIADYERSIERARKALS